MSDNTERARVDRRVHKRYRDAITGEFVTKAEADARPNETVGETVWVAVPTDAQVLAAAEAIYNSKYPYAAKGKVPLDPEKDTWALEWARAALDAAAEVRA